MTSVRAAPEDPDSLEPDRLVEWRDDQLRLAGYSDQWTFFLSRDLSIDLHCACDLLRGGASEDVALSILL